MIRVGEYELILPGHAWRQALQSLVADRSRWASGRIIREPSPETTGLLAPDMSAAGRLCTGEDFPPLSGWAAIAVPGGEPPDTPHDWLTRLRPRFGQTLALLLVGFGPARADWRGWMVSHGHVSPLSGLRIVGPGMLHVPEPDPPPTLGPYDDPARWLRVRGAVGESVFAKLRAAHVALVGCSRTGTLAATMLAGLGVGQLSLVDGDAVEPHNLDGMVLATPEDIGANKAVALARRLAAYRPDMCVKAVPHAFEVDHPELSSRRVDLVVTCVDRDGPRLRAAYWARNHLSPHLDIGTGVTRAAGVGTTRPARGDRLLAADVRLLLPGSGCVRCVGGLSELDQAEYEFYAPPRALPRRPPEPWNARGRLGSSLPLNALAASTGIHLWLDLLEGTLGGSAWHRLRWRPGEGIESHAALVGAGRECEVCGGKS